jgi:tripartite-type tricarboxylate transporter receptor subunit TctC
MKIRLTVCAVLAGALNAGAGMIVAHGQEYPTKTIRIVTSPIGGGNDFPARLIAAALTGPLGQQIVVDNRPTVLIADIVAKSPPDGYTLLLTGSAHWIGPLVEKVNYDAVRDFSALTLVDRSPNVLVVHPTLPAKNVKDLIGLAKARPGEINVAVGGPGSSNYVASVLFGHMAGVNMTRIPYKGNAPAITALLSGEVQVMFSSAGAVAPHMQSGRLRALGVSSLQPSPFAPGVPSIASAGVPGYVSEVLHAMFAPAKTPPAIVAKLNAEVSRYLRSAQAKDIFIKAGIEPSPSTPEELVEIINAEVARLGKVMKAASAGK